jgi:hypothetical protein
MISHLSPRLSATVCGDALVVGDHEQCETGLFGDADDQIEELLGR